MAQMISRALPADISGESLAHLLEGTRNREALLQATLHRFQERYGGSLETLEARLFRGEGPEHPDWEDSIEWRNAVEALQSIEASQGGADGERA